jgi:hypothetical protein
LSCDAYHRQHIPTMPLLAHARSCHRIFVVSYDAYPLPPNRRTASLSGTRTVPARAGARMSSQSLERTMRPSCCTSPGTQRPTSWRQRRPTRSTCTAPERVYAHQRNIISPGEVSPGRRRFGGWLGGRPAVRRLHRANSAWHSSGRRRRGPWLAPWSASGVHTWCVRGGSSTHPGTQALTSYAGSEWAV